MSLNIDSDDVTKKNKLRRLKNPVGGKLEKLLMENQLYPVRSLLANLSSHRGAVRN